MGAVYTQLSITERRKIEHWRHAKVTVDEMARPLRLPAKTARWSSVWRG
jgi:IS30 family transposase